MADLGANGPLIASLLQAQRQDTSNPFAQQRKFGQDLIIKGSSTAPLQSGHWLEGLSRALQGGLGGFFAGQANRAEDEQNRDDIGIMSEAAKVAATNPTAAADMLKGLKGNSYESRALLGQLLQGAFTTGIANQQADAGIKAGGYGAPPANGAGLVIDINKPTPTYQTGGTSSGFDNNLMNIRASSAPFAEKGPPQNGFETFATPQAGANATVDNFKAYVQQNPTITVAQAIAKWAPPNENNTNGYISRVSETSGINPATPLAQVMQNPVDMARLMEAAIPVEKGKIPAGVTPDVLVNAGQRAAGGAPPPQPAPGVQVAQAGQAAAPQSTEAAQLRARADQLKASGNKVDALALYRKADEIAGKFSDTTSMEGYKQTLQQPNQTITNEGKLRDDYRGEPAVKAYREVVPILESAKEAVERPTRAADLNLIYALGKIMDPNSVVREGEMVMARGTGTVQDTINGLLGQLNGGQTLLPETRKRLVDEMQSRFTALESSHNTISDVYKGIAQRSGLNPENVVIPIRQGKPAQQEAAPAKAGPQRIDLNGNPL